MKMDDGRVFSDILADILNDRDIQLYSDGSESRPFCYVADTVLGLFHILLKGVSGEAYNVGETHETTILELAEKMVAVAGKKGRIQVRTQTQSPLPPAARSSGHFNIDKIKSLQWAPRINLDAGLEKTFGFYK